MIGSVDIMRFFAATALISVAFLTPVLAFDHSDRASLGAALDRYAAHIEAERLEEIDAVIPPGVYTMLSEKSGESEGVMRARMIDLERRVLGDTDVLDVRFDTERVDISTTAQGRDYAFIPTATVTSMGIGPDTTTFTQTFALQDTGMWYFFRLKQRSDFSIIQAAYPDFSNIQSPPLKDTP